MSRRPSAHSDPAPRTPGLVARSPSASLRSYQVGALPIINRFLERMGLLELLETRLRRQDRRARVGAPRALLVLVRNLLLEREPIYALGEWAARQAPDLLGLPRGEAVWLSDDCLGRALDRLFDAHGPTFTLAVMRRVVAGFHLRLEELHNDSTTVTFSGAYQQAQTPRRRRGRETCAITYGYNKDHRPDLKQLLYILTVTEDGGVPVHVQVASGNTTDDETHLETWEFLRRLVGRPDFVYVADCKLASTNNLKYIAGEHGRFVTVLPGSRREDTAFRKRLRQQPQTLTWRWLYDVCSARGKVLDEVWVCEQQELTREGWRLYWYRSRRKEELDAQGRASRAQRATAALSQLQKRLAGPRCRLRERAKIRELVDEILQQFQAAKWLKVTIRRRVDSEFKQAGPGRPGPNTKYKRRQKRRWELTWRIDSQALAEEQAGDGVFPLVTNLMDWTEEQVLRCYKRQPMIEKRFSQLKTDFVVAPMWLKEVSRIEALLVCYFLALLVQTLLERELRQAMEREGLKSLPLYPEGRPCRQPTARRIFDVFEPVQRHHLQHADGTEEVLVTELTPLQRQILKLLGISDTQYGR